MGAIGDATDWMYALFIQRLVERDPGMFMQ
jgi:hypothetical protein